MHALKLPALEYVRANESLVGGRGPVEEESKGSLVNPPVHLPPVNFRYT